MTRKQKRQLISSEFIQGVFFVDRIRNSVINYVDCEKTNLYYVWGNVGSYVSNALEREKNQIGKQKSETNK